MALLISPPVDISGTAGTEGYTRDGGEKVARQSARGKRGRSHALAPRNPNSEMGGARLGVLTRRIGHGRIVGFVSRPGRSPLSTPTTGRRSASISSPVAPSPSRRRGIRDRRGDFVGFPTPGVAQHLAIRMLRISLSTWWAGRVSTWRSRTPRTSASTSSGTAGTSRSTTSPTPRASARETRITGAVKPGAAVVSRSVRAGSSEDPRADPSTPRATTGPRGRARRCPRSRRPPS